jgi:hypothetical protein
MLLILSNIINRLLQGPRQILNNFIDSFPIHCYYFLKVKI